MKVAAIIILQLIFSSPIVSVSSNIHRIHIARCITNISQTYFPRDRSLVISWTPKLTNMTKNLFRKILLFETEYLLEQEDIVIQAIHRLQTWAIVTLDISKRVYKFNKHIRQELKKPGSYIILSFTLTNNTEMSARILEKTKQVLPWNPEANIIFGAFSNSSNNKIIAEEILKQMWKAKLVNSIVLLPVIENIQAIKQSINGVLDVYTWFPYSNQTNCREVTSITLINKWSVNDGFFINNNDLYPEKIGTNLHMCPLIISSIECPPLIMKPKLVKLEDSNETQLIFTEGTEVDIIKLITRSLNMSVIYIAKEDMGIGVNSSAIRLRDLMDNKADISIRGWLLERESVTIADPTLSYYMESMKWFVPCAQKLPQSTSIVRVFKFSLWITFFVSLFVSAFIFVCIEKLYRFEKCSKFTTVTASISNMWAVMLGISVSSMPTRVSLRMYFICWVVYCLGINTIFQAFMVTFLVDSGYEHQISSLDELYTQNLDHILLPGHEAYFRDVSDIQSKTVLKNRKACNDLTSCNLSLRKSAKFRNISVIWSEGLMKYMILDGLVDKAGKPLLCTFFGSTVSTTNTVMYLVKGSPLLQRVNDVISRVIEAGMYYQWVEMFYHGLQIKARVIGLASLADDYYNLNMEHMQSPFYLLLIGLCIALVIFIVELCRYH
ncbi:hypothetical protein L9F63_011729 [Diploptera punctata]|uniref:Uncharacterized protein n=1 Tax=Diploptera punctata TaxID=6984 RepID=A0AAD8AE06_DIPPU|nr:hypothetical protein L9F63_011729 [Diploptera punctata]